VSVNAIVLTGFGINCDLETAEALRRAGAVPSRRHVNDLVTDPGLLDGASILAVPGGFSFGDHVGSGRILANRLRHQLGDPLRRFVDAGNLVIGICNGFQVLAKMGILPRFDEEFRQEVTLTHNDSGRFENRWVVLQTQPATPCVWLRGIDRLELPVRHGEGKFIPRDGATLERLRAGGHIALRYAGPGGTLARGAFPANPNGSVDDIAGICDATGRVFGLMPHPEAFRDGTNHPLWTRRGRPEDEGAGLQVFRNAVAYVRERG
jgi:phosphoribosylformylglycinamidine synthase